MKVKAQAKYKVVSKLIRNLTPDEYAQCCKLGYRHDGCIINDLKWLWSNGRASKSRAVMCVDARGKIRSWALIDYSKGRWTEGNSRPMVQCWTQRRFRRKGLGARVMTKVKKHLGCTFDHFTIQATEFFAYCGIKMPPVNYNEHAV